MGGCHLADLLIIAILWRSDGGNHKTVTDVLGITIFGNCAVFNVSIQPPHRPLLAFAILPSLTTNIAPSFTPGCEFYIY